MDKIEEILTRGVEKIYPSKNELEKILRSGKKLRVYQGFDPSMSNLHLGNTIGLLKLKKFQELGHKVIFLVGDFTGMIGDPTDKISTRPSLNREQVLKNCKNWKKQAGKILSFSGKNPAEFVFNSKWLDKLTLKELIKICSKFTVQQLIERDFFQKRLKKGNPIFLHEFLYPIAQAIDSFMLDVDLEIGGSDQTFNMLAGRTLTKILKGKEKFVLTMKLLVNKKGEKVGKTTGNAIFLNTSPNDMFGAVMSFPDETIVSGFELLTDVPLQQIKEVKKALQSIKVNPMDFKKELAFEVVKIYHGEKKAKKAKIYFERVFQKKKLPLDNILIYKIKPGEKNIIDLLVETKLAPSKSEAKRLVKQGAIEAGGKTIKDKDFILKPKEGMIIKSGKRKFIKLHLI